MANLDTAKELLAWMRAEGLTHARVGDIELTLEEATPRDLPDYEGPEWEQKRRHSILEEDPQLYGEDERAEVPTFPDLERA